MKLLSMHVDDFGGLHNFDYSFDDGLNVLLHDNGWGKTTMAAFLKAMLYGYDSKRSKDITENERKRFIPWQGGKYGGSLDFEANDTRYRITRTFGETPRFDRTKIENLDTNVTARIAPDRIGETLFHLDANAFQRSVFINQNGLSIDGAASSIHTRLNTIVSQANDVMAYDDAISGLTQQIKVYEKTGARGQIGVITRQIEEKEEIRDRLERDIVQQDAARERIAEIDALLRDIDYELVEQAKKLDDLSGKEKEREAAKKLLEGIDSRLSTLQTQIDAINDDLGGSIPSTAEIDNVKRDRENAAALRQRIQELETIHKELTEDYNAQLERYNYTLPSAARLDEIQAIYGELQGALSAGNSEVSEPAPEEYVMIKAAVGDDPDYLNRLQITIGSQMTFQELIYELEVQDQRIQSDAYEWGEKTKRYASLKAETSQLEKAVEEQKAYAPAAAESVISQLEDLLRSEQMITAKKESLAGELLTQEQEDFLGENTGELPDALEGNIILKKQREAAKLRAEIQGLTARLEGEKSRANSLDALLKQIEAAASLDIEAPPEPDKSFGSGLIAAGATVAVIGIVLGIIVMPVLFAATAIGAILLVLGVVNNNKHKQQVQDYTEYQSKFTKKTEAMHKRDELLEQQAMVQTSIAELEEQIGDCNNQLLIGEAAVSAWLSKWGPPEAEVSETTISEIIDKAEKIAKLREKQDATASIRVQIDERTAAMESERETIDKVYPGCHGKSVTEALSFIRAKLSMYMVSEGQLQTAAENEAKYIEEIGVSREELEFPDSPQMAELKASREKTALALQNKLDDANRDLAVLGLDTDVDHIVIALHEAAEMYGVYCRYADKINEQKKQQYRQKQQVEVLQRRLSDSLTCIADIHTELGIPQRLPLIREELIMINQLKENTAAVGRNIEQQRAVLSNTENSINDFIAAFGRFDTFGDDKLQEIVERVKAYAELVAAKQQLEKQRSAVVSESAIETSSEEEALSLELSKLKERRDGLLIEYTQKGDFIRQADQSLEKYPELVEQIRELYEQKQKAQNNLVILKRTIQLITKAKENLANRYLGKVENLFNNYMRIWLNNDAIKGILDIDFNVTVEEDGKTHVAEGYSTGYYDLIDFCMRLALVDTLFENEQPFLIMDDPFVHFDDVRLEKALELLTVLAANKQIVYFVCHPIRAIEPGGNSSSRTAFLELAEATKNTRNAQRSVKSETKPIVRKSARDFYRIGDPNAVPPFLPAKPSYTITNSIFSMNFILNEDCIPKDQVYELFFIDASGHVLNDRQLIEINNGKLSTDRIQFNLNTRDNSGDVFELMIRESGQDDYEVIARIPFRTKIAFTGTFSFDI